MSPLDTAKLNRMRATLATIVPSNPGRTAARVFRTLASCQSHFEYKSFIERQGWEDELQVKAAVEMLTTGNSAALTSVGADFMGPVRDRAILGRALIAARQMPFNVRMIRQTGGATAGWVREGEPVAAGVGSFSFDPGLPALKVAALTAATEELIAASDAEEIVTRDLQEKCKSALDRSFSDPSNAGVAGKEPASVFYGVASAISSGSDADAIRADFLTLLDLYQGNLASAAIITSTKVAAQLALLQAMAGNTQINLAGESVFIGMPLLASDAVPTDSNGTILGLVDLSRLEIAGLQSAEIAVTRQAAIQLNDTPDANQTAGTTLVSLYQTNCVGLLAKIYCNWRAAPGAAAFISNVNYGG